LAEGKGQDELISMLRALPDAVLVLVGDGPQRAVLERLAHSVEVRGRVRFLGERDDIHELLPLADCFALASHSEGLPLSVLEAAACGLPVVAYDLPGLRAVITDGHDGLLVPQRDQPAFAASVRALLADGALRARLAQSARHTAVSRFDVRAMARRTESVYDVVLGVDAPSIGRLGGRHLVTG
jgi:glycosyltransferase involved in cell wall biosynthesis